MKSGLLVFVSSKLTKGAISQDPKMISGIDAADKFCTDLAAVAIADGKLKGSGYSNDGTSWPFKAWLSAGAPASSPLMRFPSLSGLHDSMGYFRQDGSPIALNKIALLDGNLDGPIQVTELGEHLEDTDVVAVWSATATDGKQNGMSAHCNGWISGEVSDDAPAGLATSMDTQWSVTSAVTCDNSLRIYCFEQPSG